MFIDTIKLVLDWFYFVLHTMETSKFSASYISLVVDFITSFTFENHQQSINHNHFESFIIYKLVLFYYILPWEALPIPLFKKRMVLEPRAGDLARYFWAWFLKASLKQLRDGLVDESGFPG